MRQITIFLLLMVAVGSSVMAQATDSIPPTSAFFYFEDGIGNRDTVEIVFSSDHLPGVHPQGFEVDQSDIPFDSVFEVRLTTEELATDSPPNIIPSFLTDKLAIQLLNTHPQLPAGYCNTNSSYPWFIVNLCHLPLTVSWDGDLFQDGGALACLDGSYILNQIFYNLSQDWEETMAFGSHNDGACLAGNNQKVFDVSPDWPQSAYPQLEFSYALHHIEGSSNEYDALSIFTFFHAHDFQTLCDSPVSTQEPIVALNFTLYPNPVNDRLFYELSQGERARHRAVYDATGRCLLTESSVDADHKGSLAVGGLPTGVYYLQLTTERGKTLGRKFVKW